VPGVTRPLFIPARSVGSAPVPARWRGKRAVFWLFAVHSPVNKKSRNPKNLGASAALRAADRAFRSKSSAPLPVFPLQSLAQEIREQPVVGCQGTAGFQIPDFGFLTTAPKQGNRGQGSGNRGQQTAPKPALLPVRGSWVGCRGSGNSPKTGYPGRRRAAKAHSRPAAQV
jgi:hypothetical protein